jgi:CP family cyanate transporter-like MFS transporter
LTIPSDRSKEYAEVSSAKDNSGSWQHRLILTLTSRDPWFIALIFAMYSCQWLAVIGFLPTIFEQAGFSSAFAGLVTAVVSLANILGNVGAGHLLHRQFSALKLLRVAFFLMAICTLLAFGSVMNDLPVLRFVAVLFFSAIGGMIPAVLFSLAVQLAPNEQTISTTVGWVQQCSSAGQFVGPPLVAWAVVTIGGWGGIWMVACAASLVGYTFASILNARNNL